MSWDTLCPSPSEGAFISLGSKVSFSRLVFPGRVGQMQILSGEAVVFSRSRSKVPIVLLLSELTQMSLGWGQNVLGGPGLLDRSGDSIV